MAVFSPQNVSAGDLEEGRAAIGSGDYAKAHSLLAPLAREGDAVAQNAMGVLYMQGWGVEPDPERAAEYFRRSSEQGNIKGTLNLADAYRRGVGVKQSCLMAKDLLIPVAQDGLAQAQVTLGSIFDTGCPDLSSDPDEAFRWYSAAAVQKDPYGLGNVGAMYALGLGVEQNYSEAMKYYSEAAALGNGKAAYNLARMYEYGEGMSPDLEQARQWYSKAVQLGVQEASKRLETLDGGGGAQDTSHSVSAFDVSMKPPLELARSYGSIRNLLEILPLAEAGVTLQLPDGVVNRANVAAVRRRLEQQLVVYEQAVKQRGSADIAGEYIAEANGCAHSESSWALLIDSGYDHIHVEQDDSRVTFEASKKRRRKNVDRTASGFCVENAISLIDPMNTDYVLIGDYLDGQITIRPDIDSILQAWPDFVQPPSRKSLSSCLIKLSPVGRGAGSG